MSENFRYEGSKFDKLVHNFMLFIFGKLSTNTIRTAKAKPTQQRKNDNKETRALENNIDLALKSKVAGA